MAKVRKKYNKAKQYNRFAKHHLKDLVVAYTDDLKGCVMLDTKRQELVKPNELTVACIEMPHQWSCFIAAMGRTQLGEEYMKAEQIFTPSKFYQRDLAPIFEAHHAELIKQMPDHHLCSVGWIACPNGREFTEKEAADIFTKLGAWS